MAWHPDSIRRMTRWEVVDEHGSVVLSADAITTTAELERRRPVDVAKREARLHVNPEAGDAPVTARRAHPTRFPVPEGS